jgi:signal transduction histidine kinase
MAQVFPNLVGNAVRHGDLKRPVHVNLQRVGGNAVFSVHNFGETIPADAIPHLFTFGGRHFALVGKFLMFLGHLPS